ncbi:MAG TPA: hypothetical protein VJN93_06940 [Candidatus Acidoferrum sp.]|nr:hypothetical protein [Candidatus Acidoferrum sp.]
MDEFVRQPVTCEQAEAIVLDLGRDNSVGESERAAALAHLGHCPRCAALLESWQAAKEELRLLAEGTAEAATPARVEMRLRQEFRTKHRTFAVRRGAIVAAWALAAAAILAVGWSWRNWERTRAVETAKQDVAKVVRTETVNPPGEKNSTDETLSADASSPDDLADFTPLPGASPDVAEQASILRVRMQRGSLSALGLPVNEQNAGDWIQVDLLVGTDGLPEAVRLAQEEN